MIKSIDLGCGPQNKPDCLHVDQPGSKKYYPHVDIEIDLDTNDWYKAIDKELPGIGFETIYAEDIVEHLHDLITFMNQCHELALPKAHMFIRTPSYDSAFGWIDPTHVRLYALDTFDFFDPETPYGKYNIQLTPYKWKVISKKKTENGNLEFELEKIDG